jgi:chemotaxis protein methyltransferase CheR
LISDERAFSLLKRRIFLDRGLDCEQYKENYLKRRIAVRLRATEAENYLEYLQVLRKNPEEYTKLLNELTINVTQFFRDADVYKRLREFVIPSLVEAKTNGGSRALRVWSAGCASGEEPYSMAMLIDEVLGAETSKWNVRVVGSDYDERSLRVAKAGIYRNLELPEHLNVSLYFKTVETPSGWEYAVREDTKNKVRFEKINLLEFCGQRRFDLVMCRNVLIYFGRVVQTKLIEALAGSIMGEGYLVLGKSETVGPEASSILKPAYPIERIYQAIPDSKFGSRTRGPGNTQGGSSRG